MGGYDTMASAGVPIKAWTRGVALEARAERLALKEGKLCQGYNFIHINMKSHSLN